MKKIIVLMILLSNNCFYLQTALGATGKDPVTNSRENRISVSNSSASEEKIVFVRGRGENSEIFIMRPDGKKQIRLTENNVYDGEPTFSPDGTQIAFVRNGQIYRMDADGKNQVCLSTLPNQTEPNNHCSDSEPKWSPDGKSLLYKRAFAKNTRLYTVHADGTDQKEVAFSDAPVTSIRYASWSPKGDRIAFSSWVEPTNSLKLCLIKPDGTGLITLHSETSIRGDINWSPDGNTIVFEDYSRNRIGECVKYWARVGDTRQHFDIAIEMVSSFREIATINIDTSGYNTLVSWTDCIAGRTKIYGNQLTNEEPLWSPNGSMIAFLSTRNDTEKRMRPAKRQLFVIDLKEKKTNLLLPDAGIKLAGWSPDGSKVLFVNSEIGMIGHASVDEIGKVVFLCEGHSPCWWGAAK